MEKINFRGREMGDLELKLYLCGLKYKLINSKLNKEEEQNYDEWKLLREERNENSKIRTGKEVYNNLSTREYLIDTLKRKIKISENTEKKKYCDSHGHKEMKGSSIIKLYNGEETSYVLCLRCDSLYERRPTQKELEKFRKKIYNSFRE